MFDLQKYTEKPCLHGMNITYTYDDVDREARKLGASFNGRSLILCLCENKIAAIIGYIAFIIHDQVTILVDASQKSESTAKIVENYAPEYIWANESQLNDLPSGKVVYSIDDYVLLQTRDTHPSEASLNSRLQILLSTSGSTGSSKFVRLSRSNLESNATSIIEYLKIYPDDVAVTSLPFNYSFGLSIINSHLLAGASIAVTELTPLSRDFWDLIRRKNVSSLSGVPYTFDILKRIKFERFDLPALRYLSQAGGKLTQAGFAYLQQVASEKGLSCFLMYGQTEATARMSYLSPEHFNAKVGSIGQPIPNGKFSIVGDDGRSIVEPFTHGELVYAGANVALGYADSRADLVRGDDWNGQLNTGDVAYRDEDDFYYIAGRLKRFLKLYGNRVSLDELELHLQLSFAECEFICSGQDDCLKIGYVGELTSDQIVSCLVQRFSIARSSVKCISISEIPRLSNGKINYQF
jgi:acyl-CoA synthetase (AMP-forming)/AMP-acid ligase II